MDDADRRTLRTIAEHLAEIHSEWPELKAFVFSTRKQQQEHERRISRIESWREEHEIRHRHEAEASQERREIAIRRAGFNPDLTPGGGIRLPPEGWERLKNDFEAFKNASEVNKARADGAADALESLKRRVLFYLALAGAGGSVLAYALTHFLKL